MWWLVRWRLWYSHVSTCMLWSFFNLFKSFQNFDYAMHQRLESFKVLECSHDLQFVHPLQAVRQWVEMPIRSKNEENRKQAGTALLCRPMLRFSCSIRRRMQIGNCLHISGDASMPSQTSQSLHTLYHTTSVGQVMKQRILIVLAVLSFSWVTSKAPRMRSERRLEGWQGW